MDASSEPVPDKELWKNFVYKADEGSFDVLVQRYKLRLFDVAFRVLYDQHAAEDVVQRVFVRLVQRKNELTEVESLQAWLYSTALNLSLDIKRSMRRRKDREKAGAAASPPETPRETAARAEVERELEVALGKLKDSSRIPLVFRYLHGLTYVETGQVMKLSPDAVRRRTRRALRRLRKLLQGRGLLVSLLAVEEGLKALPAKAASANFLSSASSIIHAASTAGIAGTAAGTATSVLKGGLLMTAKGKIAIGIGAAVLLVGALIHFTQKGKSTDRIETRSPVAEAPSSAARLDSTVEGERKQDERPPIVPAAEISQPPVESEEYDIAGTVIDKAGKPIEGALVYMNLLGTDYVYENRLRYTTKADGKFGFHCPEAREYYLVASKQDYVRVQNIITRPQKDMVIMLLLGGAIEGNVVDAATDEAVEQFRMVESRDYGYSRVEEIYRSDRGRLFRDSEGRFRLSGLEAGTYRLTSIAEGYAQSSVNGIKVELEKTARGVVIKQQPAGGVRGRVVDAIGSPIEWAEIVQKTQLTEEYPSLGTTLATSDGRGEFEIRGLPAGTSTLEARHGRYAPAERTVEVRRGELTEGVEFQLGEGVSLSGLVVAEGDSLPIAGATVRLRAGPRNPHYIMTHSGGITTRTDHSGQFRFPNLKPGTYYLTASAPNFADETKDDVIVQKDKAVPDLIMKLSQGGSLVGTVRDHSGKPMADTEVSAVCVLMQRRTSTDGDGKYAITHLKEGVYSVGVFERLSPAHRERSEDFDARIENGKETRLDIVIGGPRRVYGKVTCGGEPQAGVEIALRSSSKTIAATKIQAGASDTTGPDGGYEIGRLKPGEYVLFVADTPFRTTILVVDEDVEKNIELPEGGISGRVLDAGTGRPIEGAKVGLQPRRARDYWEARSLSRGYHRSDKTDPEGRYKFAVVEDGMYFVVAEKEGYAPQAATAEVQNSQGRVGLDVLLSKGAILQGQVRGSDPAWPVREIFLSVRDSNGAMVYSKKISLTPEGEYETGMLSPGEYTISVKAREYAPAAKAVRIVAGADNRADFVLPAGGTLIVRAIDDRGNPVPGARAHILDQERNYVVHFFSHFEDTEEEGVTVTPHISEGVYRVEVGGLGYEDEFLDVSIREGERAEVRVRLRRSR